MCVGGLAARDLAAARRFFTRALRTVLVGPMVLAMDDAVPRRLDWEREELILAGDLVARNGWRQIAATDPRVIELSALLRRLPLHPVHERRPDFRNVNSVARKTADLATNRPGHPGRATNSGVPTKRVIAEFTAEPGLMHGIAASIRAAEARWEFAALTSPVPDEDEGAAEGRLLIRRHVAYERNRALGSASWHRSAMPGGRWPAKSAASTSSRLTASGAVATSSATKSCRCMSAGSGRTKLSDLALLCANCHRVSHGGVPPPWLTPGEPADLMRLVLRQAAQARTA